VTQRLGEGKNHVNTPSYDSSQAPLITQQMGESRNHVHTLSHDSNQTHSMKRQMEEATLHVGAPSYDSNQAHLMTHQMEEDRLHFQIPTRNAPNQADNQTLYPEGGEFHSWKAPHISITPQTGSTVHFWPSQEYFISQVYTPTSQFGRSADSVSTQPVHFHNQFYAPPTQTSHTPWTPTAYALNQAHQARAMSGKNIQHDSFICQLCLTIGISLGKNFYIKHLLKFKPTLFTSFQFQEVECGYISHMNRNYVKLI